MEELEPCWNVNETSQYTLECSVCQKESKASQVELDCIADAKRSGWVLVSNGEEELTICPDCLKVFMTGVAIGLFKWADKWQAAMDKIVTKNWRASYEQKA